MSQLKEVTMVRPYLPSFFGRGDDPFGSLFREVQKTFEDFSQRTPFARFTSDTLSPKIDIAESKDAIEVTAELPGVDENDLDVTLVNGMLTVRGVELYEHSCGGGRSGSATTSSSNCWSTNPSKDETPLISFSAAL